MIRFIKKNPFNFWMFNQATSIFVATIMAAQLNGFIQNMILKKNVHYDPLEELWIAFPMVIIVTVISYFSSKNLFKYITKITNGIKEVSQGNFHVKLEVSKAGPYQDVFQNFNLMTAELSSVEILKSDFINKFSHEFKTPITSIHGFAELLLNQEVPEADHQQYLEIIFNESKRLSELANNIMILSKLKSQEIVVEVKRFDLEEQLKQTVILLLPEINEKNLQLTLDLKSVFYKGNQEMMQQVWLNLLNNAVKYTQVGGEIALLVEETDKEIFVSFRNSGGGIASENLEKVFDEYFQQNQDESSQGLGLGLTIVQRILTLTKNTITVTSERDIGTTFKICLKK